ncbi:ribokinase [Enterococcus sp. LJL120]
MKTILVIGSSSTDFIVTTKQLPASGETVFGEAFATRFGGKGANQAVAASRLGVAVTMIGSVGADSFGEKITENLQANQVDVQHFKQTAQQSSGSAHITLYEGDNRIIVVPAANNLLTVAYLKQYSSVLSTADFVILQNEIPQESNLWVIDFCAEKAIPLLYNPAPAREISAVALAKTTYFTPNEQEVQQLFPKNSLSESLRQFPNQLIVTLGKKGAIFFDGEEEITVPAFATEAVDTTGAGDTFNGAFAVGILRGLPIAEAIRLGNLAASFSVQGFGAQGGMPTLADLKTSADFTFKF